EKYWSFLLLPLVFFSQENFYFKYKELIFKGLLTGCIATLLICYLNVFYEIYTKDQPLYYFFTWGHLNLRFTDVADTHPAYLGLFLVTSTLYLFLESKLHVIYKYIIFLFFSLAMFQLTSRTAMGLYIIGLVLVLLLKRRGVILFSMLILIGGMFIFNSNKYLKGRMFSFEHLMSDQRFERLGVSLDIFKENPILGVGFSKIDEERTIKYKKEGYTIA